MGIGYAIKIVDETKLRQMLYFSRHYTLEEYVNEKDGIVERPLFHCNAKIVIDVMSDDVMLWSIKKLVCYFNGTNRELVYFGANGRATNLHFRKFAHWLKDAGWKIDTIVKLDMGE